MSGEVFDHPALFPSAPAGPFTGVAAEPAQMGADPVVGEPARMEAEQTLAAITRTADARDLADPAVQSLLGRSALYEALALALAYPEPEALGRLADLTADLSDHAVLTQLGLEEPLAELRALEPAVDAERLAPAYCSLFEGTVPCSPHETAYLRDGLAKAAQLADIAGFYRAFGLRVGSLHQTVPDYVGTELEFMAHLTRREAYALVQGWEERAAICQEAGRGFLKAHLGRWAGAFAADLGRHAALAAADRGEPAAGAWYQALAGLVAATVAADTAYLQVRPSLLHSRSGDPENAAAPDCPLAINGDSLAN